MTAYCSPSWTSWLIKILCPKANLILNPLLFFKKNIYIYGLWRFRRFRGLLIHSFVTPKNMEKSSQNFGDQPLKIQIVQKFYLSAQIWYPIHSLKMRAQTKHFFLWIAHFTSFSFIYSSVALRITRSKKFSEGHS